MSEDLSPSESPSPPPSAERDAELSLTDLLRLMARLRDPERGCPWDLEQTFATIAPYTIEEAYEVADAIEHGNPSKIRDELGDLLFQVAFHSRMAEERGWFDFAAVARSIHTKLVRRHPHIFGADGQSDNVGQRAGGGSGAITNAELMRTWDQMKAEERAAAALTDGGSKAGTLDDVPRGLPALSRAAKLGRRASRVGFDWPEAAPVRDKIMEEIREVDEAIATARIAPPHALASVGAPQAGGTGAAAGAGAAWPEAAAQTSQVAEEIGDLLFSVVNWSRHLKVDPEEALRAANAKFEKRFRGMEALAAAAGRELQQLSVEEWEGLWNSAKRG